MIAAQGLKYVQLLKPTNMTNSQTQAPTCDFKGHDYATIVVSFSSESNTNAVGPTITLAHCDTSNGTFTTLSSVAGADGNLVAAKAYVFHVDLSTRARYGKLSITTGTTTNDNVSVAADMFLSRAEQAPTSTSGMVLTQAGSNSSAHSVSIV